MKYKIRLSFPSHAEIFLRLSLSQAFYLPSLNLSLLSPQYTLLPFLYDTAEAVYLAGAAEAGVCSCSVPLTET